ncbi:MAG: hypothetical protein GX066_01605 [Clostridiaceae bacterium]|nr:hypothetical protein [Clostridiaceae bacterium]
MAFWDFLFNGREKAKKQEEADNDTGFFNEEFSTELYDTYFNETYNPYTTNGVELEKVDRAFRIRYNGLLAKSGAQDIYAVIGYGNNLKWEDVEYHHLHQTAPQNFELIIDVKREGNINISFKDGANNWDNNNGMNYCFANNFYKQ